MFHFFLHRHITYRAYVMQLNVKREMC